MSRGAGAPREVWGCECEQGAGAPRSGDATVRESLAATGMNLVDGDNALTAMQNKSRKHAGGDRRMAPDADNVCENILQGIPEAEL